MRWRGECAGDVVCGGWASTSSNSHCPACCIALDVAPRAHCGGVRAMSPDLSLSLYIVPVHKSEPHTPSPLTQRLRTVLSCAPSSVPGVLPLPTHRQSCQSPRAHTHTHTPITPSTRGRGRTPALHLVGVAVAVGECAESVGVVQWWEGWVWRWCERGWSAWVMREGRVGWRSRGAVERQSRG